jgi:hypothetical protein
MPNLSVFIKGLALFRMDDNQWKIYFPKAPDHPFKLKIKNRESDVETNYLLPAKTIITLFPNNNSRDLPGSKGNLLEEFQSKSLAQFHEEYFQEKTIKIKDKPEAFAGTLNLNGTSLQNLLDDEQENVIVWTVKEEKDANDKVIRSVRERKAVVELGSKLFASYQIVNDFTKIEIRNDSVNFDIDLHYSENNSYELLFENDCEVIQTNKDDLQLIAKGCMEASDFKYYYNILETSNRIELTVEPKPEKRPNLICSPTGG